MMSEIKKKTIRHKYDETLTFKSNSFLDFILVPVAMLTLVVLGNYGILMGHSFFNDEDAITNFTYQWENSHSNGWRPELGLGMSMFWGDPGDFHVWGIFRWWHVLFENPVTAFNVSVVLLMWGLCVSQYVFLRKALPNLGRAPSILLAPMIIFGSLRHEFLFNRHWIPLALFIGPISLVLYGFFQRPLLKHYFFYTLILFFTCALGSVVALMQIIIFSLVIFTAYFIYTKVQGNLDQAFKLFRSFLILNLSACISLIFLFGWITYSLFLEAGMVGYVRDPNYMPDSFFGSLGILSFITQFTSYLHAGLFSPWMNPLGLQFAPVGNGWINVSPIFPVVFLMFMFHKSRNFWEFSAKFVVLVLLAWQQLTGSVPGVLGLFQSMLSSYPPTKFHPVIQVFEIVIIGAIIQKIREENLSAVFSGWTFIKVLAIILIFLYAGLFLLALMVLFFPGILLSGLQGIWVWATPYIQSETILELAPLLITENVTLLNEIMGLSAILFYGSTLVFFLLLVFRKWRPLVQLQKGKLFALALLVNSLFLSWTVFPLNKESLIWDRQDLTQASPPIIIRDFDRIAVVGVKSCYSAKNVIECIKRKYLGEISPKRHVVGYRFSPSLNLSAVKSFTPKEVASFITTFLEIEGLNSPGVLRDMQVFPANYSSRLLDFTGVQYIMSPWSLPPSGNLELIHSGFQFYLYKNLNAWPYYYLADRIETIHEMKELYHSEKGVAYLWERDSNSLNSNKNLEYRGSIELSYFKFGDLEFQTSSNEEEFLVVADAWHPYWKAQVDGMEMKVVKANGVFKGVFLPPGDHKVRLFFDNKLYRPGIWISIIAWLIFVCAWIGWARGRKLKEAN